MEELGREEGASPSSGNPYMTSQSNLFLAPQFLTTANSGWTLSSPGSQGPLPRLFLPPLRFDRLRALYRTKCPCCSVGHLMTMVHHLYAGCYSKICSYRLEGNVPCRGPTINPDFSYSPGTVSQCKTAVKHRQQ